MPLLLPRTGSFKVSVAPGNPMTCTVKAPEAPEVAGVPPLEHGAPVMVESDRVELRSGSVDGKPAFIETPVPGQEERPLTRHEGAGS